MKSFRSWSRRAWFLHGYLIAVLALMPAPSVRSVWIDTDSDTVKDSWEDTTNNVTHPMTALDAMNLDVDGDGAYNSEELTYGSDPFDLDSDDDGLNDGDEIHLANEQAQKGYSLLLWDSNGDGVSDHDDFYGFTGVTYPGGALPSFANATYSDYDGDGIKNPFDVYPTDPTNNDADSDGIDDGEDPAPGDATNHSPYNGAAWNGNALGDDDLDGIQNFWDSYADDPQNGTNDVDNDGIEGALDPFPEDNSNYSYWNGVYWYGNVLGDDDFDGTPNYSDQWPYDSNNGAGEPGGTYDSDGDGLEDYLDPAPSDGSNYSSVNGVQWQGYALEDADNDGQANFSDPYPNDPYDGLPDYDGDGIANEEDPFPKDNTNYSPLNGITWWNSLFGDDDVDGILNWMDSYPFDAFNGDPDADADGIPNENDPCPWDTNNYSTINGISWGGNALADEDGDGTLNWADDSPYPSATDTDADGLDDSADPAPYDPNNVGPTNGMFWYANALGNDDADAYLNYWDDFPYDPLNGAGGVSDSDGDGMDDAADPAPGDSTNYSPYNFRSWYSNPLGDADNDGTANFYDLQPYQDNNVDSDNDGYLDSNDPAPSDWSNYSSANGVSWQNDVFGDADGDGTSNFHDATPYGEPPPVDNDQDGLTADQESAQGTSDYDPDSDDDGLTDAEEVNIFGTSPTNAHYLSQQRHWGDLYTDWQLADLADSDGDLIPDRIEQHYQLNPDWKPDGLLDRDNNGLSNIQQYNMGIALDADMDRYDFDEDGMTDVFEDFYSPALSKTNPADAVEDADGDGVLNFEEMQLVLSPMGSNTVPNTGPLGDLLVLMTSVRYPATDAPTDDSDGDDIPDWAEAAKLNPSAPDHAYFTRQLPGDLDGDGMSDAWEHKHGRWKYPNGGLNLRVATDAGADPDHDGLNNLTEYRFGTNPLAPDSDHDNVADASALYGTAISQRTLNGVTSRYQGQVSTDFTTARGTGPGSFNALRSDSELEDEHNNEPIFEKCILTAQMPSTFFGPPIWSVGNSVQAQSGSRDGASKPAEWTFEEWEAATPVPVRIEVSPGYRDQETGEDVEPVYEDVIEYQGGSGVWHYTPGYSAPWVQRRIMMQVRLPSPALEEREFEFQISRSSGRVPNAGLNSNATITYTKIIKIKKGETESSDWVSETLNEGCWGRIFCGEPMAPPQEPEWGGGPTSMSAFDGAGPRYRKIGLNGVPLPDAKPQVQDESGERDEETYIDAFSRHLEHSVTDVYASDPATLLPLTVRRNATSDVWTRKSGLRPKERPDQPFGPCWSTNLCAFVHFQTGGDAVKIAEVRDESGAGQKFLAQGNSTIWTHSREEMTNARTAGNTFDGLVLRKKFGTVCTYEMTSIVQNVALDRLEGSQNHATHTYARLVKVQDRLGNRLLYDYGNDNATLIPSRVYDPDRPGRQIFVMHDKGRVSAIKGPAGEQVLYDNDPDGQLLQVTRGGASVAYDYVGRSETQGSVATPNMDVASDDSHHHMELASITDELGRAYKFEYEYDHGAAWVHAVTSGSTGATRKYQLGLPMCVKKITIPAAQTKDSIVTLTGARSIEMTSGATSSIVPSLEATTTVAGPAGTFAYKFKDPHVFKPTLPGLEEDSRSLSITATYQQLEITSAAGTEYYKFNKDAMFALASAKDISGNETQFFYGPEGFDDPISERDAAGNFKRFTYEATTRVMDSMTDQTLVKTSYAIQPVTGLKLGETVTDAAGVVQRHSTFEYEHPVFAGFMTQSTVDGSTEDTAPPTVTTYALGMGPLGWTEATTTTATASGNLVTTVVSDPAGNKRSVIDGRGLVTNFDYDANLRLEKVTHPDGTYKGLGYDLHGNLVRETHENGVSTFHAYDSFNRRVKTTVDLNGNGVADNAYYPLDTTVGSGGLIYYGDIVARIVSYNPRGQVVTEHDARYKKTSNTYDTAGRLTEINDGGLITTLKYTGANSGGSVFDSSGFKPTEITDPRGLVTELTYDKMYRATRQKITYSIGYAAHPMDVVVRRALLAYGQARDATSNQRAQVAMRDKAWQRAVARTDPAVAGAVVDAASAELAAKGGVLAAKVSAAESAEQAVIDADEAYEDAMEDAAPFVAALAAAVVTRTNAELARNFAVQVAEQASAALNSANADVPAKEAAAASAADDAAAKVIAWEEAVADVTEAEMALATAVPCDVAGAAAALEAAQTALGAAVTAKTDAQTAATTARAAADAAVMAAADALSARNSATDAVPLREAELATATDGVAVAEEDMEEAQALATAAFTTLGTKKQERENAQSELGTATVSRDVAQMSLNDANDDLDDAEEGAEDPEVQAQHQAEAATALAELNAAQTELTALIAAEASALAASDKAQQDVASYPLPVERGMLQVATTTTEYDNAGRPTSVTDPLGRVTLTAYDVFGQIRQVTHPDGNTITTAYTHHGKPWMVTDELGHATTTEFDAAGRAVAVKAPAVDGVQAVTSTEYDAAGNAIRVTDPLGRITETQYDERNRPVAVYAPPVWDALAGAFVRPATQTTYDDMGQVLTVTDPQGRVTIRDYDNAGRAWKVTAPAVGGESPVTVTTFDAGGLAVRVTNGLNQTVTNTYDSWGRLKTTRDAQGIENSFKYDEAGNRTEVKDGKSQVTTFAYDKLNRLTEQTFANGDRWTHCYNMVRKLGQISPRGVVTSYLYDNRDRVVRSHAPDLEREHTYDDAGRLLTVTEPGNSAANVAYTYDALGRVTRETSRGQQHDYSYDLAGNRIQASYSTGRVVRTSHDALNRPELIAEGGRVTRYGYDLGGRAVMLVGGNGQTSVNSYDALGRLAERTLYRTAAMSPSEVLARFGWEHDLLGNVLAQEETWPGEAERLPGIRTTTLAYDANNRLISEEVTQPVVSGATPTTTTVYTYDAANNRASKTVSRTIAGEEPVSDEDTGRWSYTYNAANQLTGWEKRSAEGEAVQKSATLAYDASGNRRSQTVTQTEAPAVHSTTQPPAAKPGTTNYTWDAQDRLLGVTLPDGSVHSYEYDYRTRRIGTSSTTGSVTKQTAIVFSGGLSVAEWESDTGSLPVAPTLEYTRGPDMGGGVGGLLYSLRAESGGVIPKYNLSNGRGDIVAQSNQSAALTWTASYEAYGKRTKETGENKDKQRGNSKDEDPTGMSNEGFRYRDLETGVWMSRDPAGFVDGPNLYAYVMQNPWTAWDPDGLKTIKDYQNDMQEAGSWLKKRLSDIPDRKGYERMRAGAHREYNDKIRKAQQAITDIVVTARTMEHKNRSSGLSFTNEDIANFDDESSTYKDFRRSNAIFSVIPFSTSYDHVAHGEYKEAAWAATKEAAVWVALAGAGKVLSMARSGMAANGGGRIFYVGEGAEALARNIASETGHKTIFNTWYGKIGEKVSPYLSQKTSRKMWDSLSARFANGANQGDDVITVFGRHRATGQHTLPIDSQSAWKRVEYPILESKGIPYKHVLTE